MILELPIFYHTAETRQAKDAGMSYSVKDCKIRNMLFYSINAISDYLDSDNEFCEIHCNGEMFISPLTREQVAAKIQEAQLFYSN